MVATADLSANEAPVGDDSTTLNVSSASGAVSPVTATLSVLGGMHAAFV
ncbi:MAG TPA: hypothetical protein VHM89_14275 [Acidimicrobiales bacterium]|nr:hypothetical protein [Acidimicrobiales bacterium]